MKGVFCGGKIYNSDNKAFESANLFFTNGIITKISAETPDESDGVIIDCKGKLVCPGYVDIHTHGAKKLAFDDICDFDSDTLDTLLNHYLSNGVTSVFPTTTTMPIDRIVADIKCAADLCGSLPIRFPGFHVEGPYISYKRRGAHNPDLLKNPDISELHEMLKAADGKFVLRVTVAPELDGALEYIKEAVNCGVKITLGHTDADSKLIYKAIEQGADCMTHLYNAMSPLSHREPGAVGAALNSQECFAEIICDGFHICPDVVNLTYNLKAHNNKFVVITDSVSCAGVDEDFSFESAGLTVYYKDGTALLADGTIAGSCLNMHDGMKNLSQFAKIPCENAIFFSTATPAMATGVFDRIGSLENGKFADITVMNDDFSVANVFVGGKKVF